MPVRQSLKHQRILMEITRRKKNLMMITQLHRRLPHITRWKHKQNAVYLVRISKAQDQGLEFWQTKPFAIMTCATIPGDC